MSRKNFRLNWYRKCTCVCVCVRGCVRVVILTLSDMVGIGLYLVEGVQCEIEGGA